MLQPRTSSICFALFLLSCVTIASSTSPPTTPPFPPSPPSPQANEAENHYKQALSLLQSTSTSTSSSSFSSSAPSSTSSTKNQRQPQPQTEESFLSLTSLRKFIPSTVRFLAKLVQEAILQTGEGHSEPIPHDPSPPHLKDALDHLRAASDLGHVGATSLLADTLFYGHHGAPRNLTAAFDAYHLLSERNGNATAQNHLAFFYATGVGGVTERDQGKAHLYYTFAALGGDVSARMSIGYRHLMGIGTAKSCEIAAYAYKLVAEKAIEHYLSGPPYGRPLPPTKSRLSDSVGGLYGPGASASGHSGHAAQTIDASGLEDILEHYRYNADRGDFQSQLVLGQIYHQGTRLVPQNFRLAIKYLSAVAKQFFKRNHLKEGPSALAMAATANPELAKAAGQAAGLIGHMYWRGDGVRQSSAAAFKWFQRGAELGNSLSMNSLGMMYDEGVIVPMDRDLAFKYYKKAADLDNPDALVNVGLAYLNANDPATAYRKFQRAVHHGNLLAIYHLALISLEGDGMKSSCAGAVAYLKMVAEKADWLTDPFRHFPSSSKRISVDPEGAMLGYLMASERGYELGQSNAAFLLERDISFSGLFPKSQTNHLALVLWTRAANQGNVDARVKMGDYYYYGRGEVNATETEANSAADVESNGSQKPNYVKAAACYQVAGESEHSGLALWNLGWMHEHGIGVAKDFHLAKRWYDSSVKANPDGYLPVQLSLLRLYAKYYWAKMNGDEAGSGQLFTTPEAEEATSPTGGPGDGLDGEFDEVLEEGDEWDESTPEHLRRWEGAGGVNRRTRRGTHGSTGGVEAEDGEFMVYGAEEEDMLETLIILCLCLVVGWLVYVRQTRGIGGGRGNNNPNNNPNNNNGGGGGGERGGGLGGMVGERADGWR